jgi:hypothetical protein
MQPGLEIAVQHVIPHRFPKNDDGLAQLRMALSRGARIRLFRSRRDASRTGQFDE